ncbi:hypothetical protein V1519DRAFT_464356 [Lipomyces tetrasporus]
MTEPNDISSETITTMLGQFKAVMNQQNEAINTQRLEQKDQLDRQQQEIQQLQQMIVNTSASSQTAKNTDTLVKAKVREPEPFSSGPDQVETFLSQFRTYLELTGIL